MPLTHNAPRAIAAGLATAALAAPLARGELPSSEARDATARARQRGDIVTGGVRAPDRLARDSATSAAPTTRPRTRTPDAPIVVEVTRARGFDWASAGIGAGGGIALVLIALAAASTVSSRSRPARH